MSGGQIAALILAILLLLPGGCFLLFGIGIPGGWPLALIAFAIFAVAGLLFWVAFRRRSGPAIPPDAPPP
ncbi:MAG TPA: hypothetical protein VGS13_00460 [Stellaceae bacterium]|nr:hypothetical protein [Stellaceae bacterium]